MEVAEVMEALINRPNQWVRLKATGGLADIAADLNRTPGFEVTSFGTDVLARWTPSGEAVPTLADIPERPRGLVATTKEDLEDVLLVRAAELAPPTFDSVPVYDPAAPAKPSAFIPDKYQPSAAQLAQRAAFTARSPLRKKPPQ